MTEPDKLPREIEELDHEDDAIRNRAVDVLARLGDPRAVEPLIRVMNGDGSVDVAASAARALGELGDLLAVGPLTIVLMDEDEDPETRRAAAKALGNLGGPLAVGSLAQTLIEDEDPEVRAVSALALGELGDPEGAQPLIETYLDEEETQEVRSAARQALAEVLGRQTIGPLVDLVEADVSTLDTDKWGGLLDRIDRLMEAVGIEANPQGGEPGAFVGRQSAVFSVLIQKVEEGQGRFPNKMGPPSLHLRLGLGPAGHGKPLTRPCSGSGLPRKLQKNAIRLHRRRPTWRRVISSAPVGTSTRHSAHLSEHALSSKI